MSKGFLTIGKPAGLYSHSPWWDLRHSAQVWRARLQTWRRNARTRKQLANLPAYLLRDIGLTEQQVRHEIEKQFWQ